ncbi:MAG: hypothetical protein ACRENJ_00410 [Candidatus Eiseniibacteriota bacterium]
MPTLEEQEYLALTKRAVESERVAHLAWTAGALAAAITMSWSITAKSPGLMIPVVFAIAVGFYGLLRGSRQARAIAGYLEEFHEGQKGAQWYTRLTRLENQPGYRGGGGWIPLCLANAGVVVALILAWLYAGPVPRGDLMAGIVTGCSVLFGFHSISETIRMEQTDYTAQWRSVSGELKEAPRAQRAASW